MDTGGFRHIEARVLRTRRTFDDFEDYWSTTIAAPNLAPMLTTMATADVTQLKSRVREQVLYRCEWACLDRGARQCDHQPSARIGLSIALPLLPPEAANL